MADLRNRFGLLADKFLSTVILDGGLVLVAMLFLTVAVSRRRLDTFGSGRSALLQSEAYRVGHGMAYALTNTFDMKMAAVVATVTSTIGLRTAVLARWVSFVGLAIAIILLLVMTEFAWIVLHFPL